MTSDARTGLLLLCCTTGLPFLAGFLAAWIVRTRVLLYGFPGAILPKFMRERYL